MNPRDTLRPAPSDIGPGSYRPIHKQVEIGTRSGGVLRLDHQLTRTARERQRAMASKQPGLVLRKDGSILPLVVGLESAEMALFIQQEIERLRQGPLKA